MRKPLISVIVPVYQAEKYLDECVGSIAAQTYPRLEIILVDDGCRDRSPAICDAWAAKDARITVIHKENGGASTARNAGLDVAKGEYIGFVDSDDYIAEETYERLLTAISQENCSMACCRFTREAGAVHLGKGSGATWRYSAEEAAAEFLLRGRVTDSFCDKLFARELFETRRFPEHETNEEYSLFLPLLVQAKQVVAIDFDGYYYRGNENSVTNNTWQTDADIVLTNFGAMERQLTALDLKKCGGAFKEFCAVSSYSVVLQLDKHYEQISPRARENMRRYLKIMGDNLARVLLSGHVALKDKILYVMVVTRTLRPVYRLLGKM